ncbi:MAG: amidohydrolase family protein [Bryobacteraceae bacterium]|nr:amidohydrolase family protein [Bryobacteraceae bacterium]
MKRRHFLQCAGAAATTVAAAPAAENIIDIHQHTNYAGRTDEELIAHQRKMGVTKTILLPAGSQHGLAVDAGRNDSVVSLSRRRPKEFVCFANELPDLPETAAVLRKYLRAGAIGIGEQKFGVVSDSQAISNIAAIASEFRVPILLHFQHGTYNLEYGRFGAILTKFPKVNFIGHAQTFWANIDAKAVQTVLYPKGPVTPGGLTDRYLSDHANFWGDLSAGSGLNALTRDEDHARAFLERHKNRLLYGSDCDDKIGEGPRCSGSQMMAAIRRLAAAPVQRKLLHDNAATLFRLR